MVVRASCTCTGILVVGDVYGKSTCSENFNSLRNVYSVVKTICSSGFECILFTLQE